MSTGRRLPVFAVLALAPLLAAACSTEAEGDLATASQEAQFESVAELGSHRMTATIRRQEKRGDTLITDVQEALEVRRSLDEIAMELEVLKGRMRKLQNMISFSTLTLSMVERGPHMPTPTSNDPFHWVDGLGVESTEWK